MRYVCHFSCGAASAVATKLVLSEGGDVDVVIFNAFLREEHPDNRRFASDCERWFGKPITVLRDEKYGASTHELWRRHGYIKGIKGAPCSFHLKRQLLAKLSKPGDVKVIGFTAEERGRFEDLCDHFPDEAFRAPLIESQITKADCLSIIERAGIEIPAMYRLGYSNANCIGCPKGGQNYWQAIREDFPEQFAQVVQIQEAIGPNANFLQYRSGPKKGQRMPLSDLPPGRGNSSREPDFSCSFFCDLAIRQFSEGPA